MNSDNLNIPLQSVRSICFTYLWIRATLFEPPLDLTVAKATVEGTVKFEGTTVEVVAFQLSTPPDQGQGFFMWTIRGCVAFMGNVTRFFRGAERLGGTLKKISVEVLCFAIIKSDKLVMMLTIYSN